MALPDGRARAGQPAPAQEGAASASFVATNDELLGWLDVLLKGRPEQQALARTEIAMILEARGFTDDAEEAYWANVQQRATDRRAYERLIALYQLRRDRLSETLVRRQLEAVFDEPAAGTSAQGRRPPVSLARQLTGPDRPPRASEPARRARGATPTEEDAARRAPRAAPARPYPDTDATDDPPRSPPRRLPAAGRIAPTADTARQPAGAGAPLRRLEPDVVVATPSGARVGPTASAPEASRQSAPPRRRALMSGPQAVPAASVVPAAPAAGSARPRRRAALLPNPGRPPRRTWSHGGRLIALQPSIIAAFLLTSVGLAALIVFMLVGWDRTGGTRPAVTASGQLPARCADAALRFPGAHDPRGAVAAAYRQQGIDVEAPRAGGPRLTAEQAELVVGGWIGASLLLERAGQPAPKLHEWLGDEPGSPTLANALLAGRRLDGLLTADEWAELRASPATSCEGAFVQHPRNAALLRLVERAVAR